MQKKGGVRQTGPGIADFDSRQTVIAGSNRCLRGRGAQPYLSGMREITMVFGQREGLRQNGGGQGEELPMLRKQHPRRRESFLLSNPQFPIDPITSFLLHLQ